MEIKQIYKYYKQHKAPDTMLLVAEVGVAVIGVNVFVIETRFFPASTEIAFDNVSMGVAVEDRYGR